MNFLVGRLVSARRLMSCSVVFLLSSLAACGSDSPSPVSPPSAPSLAVLDFSNGPVTADVKSVRGNGACITVRGGTLTKGALTEIQPCTGSAAQEFRFLSNGEVRIGSDYCLDDNGGRGKSGDSVIVWPCHGANNQKWSTTATDEIKGINGLCLTAKGDASSGQVILLVSCGGYDSQQWKVVARTTTTPTPAPVASVGVTLSAASLTVGQTSQATAVLKDATGNVLSGRAVTWSSSAPAVASVTAAGLVTGVGAGTATISAASEGQTGAAAVTVTAVVSTPPTPPAGSCSLVTDWNARPTTAMGRPAYLQPVREPDFGTTLTRVTGDPGTTVANIGGTWGTLSGNAYAKEPAWNADMSLLVLRVMNGGTSGWLYLDGSTYQPVFRRTSIPGTQELWHPTQPDIMVFSEANGSVGYWNVRTQGITRVFTAPAGYSSATLGQGEGNVSVDGRWVVVLAKRTSDGHQVAYAVDLMNGTKSGDIDFPAFGVSDADWASVSQLGGYIVIHGVIDGVGQRVKAWSRTTLQQTGYWPTHPLGHFDLGVTPAGREVAFGGDAGTLNPTQMVTLDLGSGAFTSVSRPTTWDWHASTRNTKRPGWGVVGTNNSTAFVLSGEIYALKLDGSQAVERYAHHRSVQTDYEAAPFASPSWDGKRIIFRSNWGNTSGRPVGAYVIDTRSMCP